MTDTGKILLAAGAVALVVLLMGNKGKAGTPSLTDGGGDAKKKPVVKIDADDEGGPGEPPIIDVDSPRRVTMEEYEAARQGGDVPRPSVPEDMRDEVLATRDPSGAGRWQVENEDGTPVKANPALAKQKAQSIADHVRTKKTAYDRPRLAVWQALAGLSGVDGLYGPATQSALQRMGAKNVPKALFKGAA